MEWVLIVNINSDEFVYGPFDTVKAAEAWSKNFPNNPSWALQLIRPTYNAD